MLIWSQTGLSVHYLENYHHIEIGEALGETESGKYIICADGEWLGSVDTLDEAKRVLSAIVMAFRTAQCEVNPW